MSIFKTKLHTYFIFLFGNLLDFNLVGNQKNFCLHMYFTSVLGQQIFLYSLL